MSKKGPIILIEDDEDDYEIFNDAVEALKITNTLYWFKNAIEAMNYLVKTNESPFLIFCDVNLPLQSGIEFKKAIDSDKSLREKSIPFVFYSTSADQYIVNEVYNTLMIQGFFQKGFNFTQIKTTLKAIFDYWTLCMHPESK